MMIHIAHLLWILPLACSIGLLLAGLLTAGKDERK